MWQRRKFRRHLLFCEFECWQKKWFFVLSGVRSLMFIAWSNKKLIDDFLDWKTKEFVRSLRKRLYFLYLSWVMKMISFEASSTRWAVNKQKENKFAKITIPSVSLKKHFILNSLLYENKSDLRITYQKYILVFNIFLDIDSKEKERKERIVETFFRFWLCLWQYWIDHSLLIKRDTDGLNYH